MFTYFVDPVRNLRFLTHIVSPAEFLTGLSLLKTKISPALLPDPSYGLDEYKEDYAEGCGAKDLSGFLGCKPHLDAVALFWKTRKAIKRRERRERREEIRMKTKEVDSAFLKNHNIKNLCGLCELGGKEKERFILWTSGLIEAKRSGF